MVLNVCFLTLLVGQVFLVESNSTVVQDNLLAETDGEPSSLKKVKHQDIHVPIHTLIEQLDYNTRNLGI